MAGTRPSLEELFAAEYERLVRGLALAFGMDNAADAVQEAFIRANRRWRHVSKYDRPATWIRRVALNLLLNQQRDQRRRQQILAASAPSTEAITIEEERNTELRAALASLPERTRAVVCLYYLSELRVDEVAHALDISPGTVKSQLHAGRKRLLSLLEESS